MWFFKKQNEHRISRSDVSIRMEAIGGQGANTAGKILAEAAVLGEGYTGNHFSSFGSEKRGSPVRSFVRFSTTGKPVRTASAIQTPDLLLIFHESLILTHPEVLEGANEKTDLIINTPKKIDELIFPKNTQLRSIHLIDATTIAREKSCGINAVMLGATAELCFEIKKETLEKTLSDYFTARSSASSQNNRDGFRSGLRHTKLFKFNPERCLADTPVHSLPTLGWSNAPLGGVITNPGNSVLKDHSASRNGVIPRFIKELCFNCGFCDMVCPDYCFVWQVDENGGPNLQGIDYQYCKGCQKCVTVCPVDALVPDLESKLTDAERAPKLFPDINPQTIAERWSHPVQTHFAEKRSATKTNSTEAEPDLLDLGGYLRPEFPQLSPQRKKTE